MAARIAKELFKVSPFAFFVIFTAVWFGDASQLKLTIYYLATVTFSVLVFHVGRKCMYPTLSIEDHCRHAKKFNNIASAIIVAAFFGFQAFMSWLVVSCLTAMIR